MIPSTNKTMSQLLSTSELSRALPDKVETTE